MKIVIVDDEPKIRNGLSKLLSSRPGFDITGVFENAMEALEQLSVSYADVIITDIKMPEINGLDLINRIREKDENTKIIILSGYSDFSFAQRAIELGVTGNSAFHLHILLFTFPALPARPGPGRRGWRHSLPWRRLLRRSRGWRR